MLDVAKLIRVLPNVPDTRRRAKGRFRNPRDIALLAREHLKQWHVVAMTSHLSLREQSIDGPILLESTLTHVAARLCYASVSHKWAVIHAGKKTIHSEPARRTRSSATTADGRRVWQTALSLPIHNRRQRWIKYTLPTEDRPIRAAPNGSK